MTEKTLTFIIRAVFTTVLFSFIFLGAFSVHAEDVESQGTFKPSESAIFEEELRLITARDFHKRGRREKALENYRAWLLDHPGDTRATEILRTITELDTDLERNIAFTESYIEAKPESEASRTILLPLGDLHGMKGEHEKALSSYRSFLAMNPGDPDTSKARHRSVACMISLGRFQDALDEIGILRIVAPDYSTRADIEESQALCLVELEKIREATIIYKRIISRYPNYSFLPRAYLMLGLCLEDRGQYETAVYWYQDLHRLFPESLAASLGMKRMGDIGSIFPELLPEEELESKLDKAEHKGEQLK